LTTRCPTECDPDCDLGGAGCHERHLTVTQRDHDPEECERQRAVACEDAVGAPQMSFSCPCCGTVSHHPADAGHGYCDRCSWFTADSVLGPFHLEKPCPYRETRPAGLPEMLGQTPVL
jgi:hypothetical protein